jgi:hypothetical protein
MSEIRYNRTPEFEKDLKRLLKRFRTLEEDLKTAQERALDLVFVYHTQYPGLVQIPGIGSKRIQIYKLRTFACKALIGKGVRSGIRLVLAYIPDDNRVAFLQIYFKADDEREDRGRIRAYLKQIHSE